MADFSEILGKKAAEVEKPKPKPAGTYLAQVNGMAKQKTIMVQGEERKILSFSCKLIAAQDDVDQDDLNDPKVGSIDTWPPFARDIWIDTPEGEFALRKFLTDTLKIEPEAKKLGEMVAETPGLQLLVTLKHRPYTDRNTNEAEIATEIGGTAAV